MGMINSALAIVGLALIPGRLITVIAVACVLICLIIRYTNNRLRLGARDAKLWEECKARTARLFFVSVASYSAGALSVGLRQLVFVKISSKVTLWLVITSIQYTMTFIKAAVPCAMTYDMYSTTKKFSCVEADYVGIVFRRIIGTESIPLVISLVLPSSLVLFLRPAVGISVVGICFLIALFPVQIILLICNSDRQRKAIKEYVMKFFEKIGCQELDEWDFSVALVNFALPSIFYITLVIFHPVLKLMMPFPLILIVLLIFLQQIGIISTINLAEAMGVLAAFGERLHEWRLKWERRNEERERKKEEEAERERKKEEKAERERRKEERAEKERKRAEAAAERERKKKEAERERKEEEKAERERRKEERAEKERKRAEEAERERRKEEKAEKERKK
jgi:hypothetical protein